MPCLSQSQPRGQDPTHRTLQLSMPNNYSHYLDDIWLSEVDNPEHKIRLIPAQWYGWATDSSPNIESPFDETFTIPDFED